MKVLLGATAALVGVVVLGHLGWFGNGAPRFLAMVGSGILVFEAGLLFLWSLSD